MANWAEPLLLAHLAATLFMTGLIWFVQIVHYPLFANVGGSEFSRYASEHQRRTTTVVMPVMLVEMGSGILLALFPPGWASPGRLWIALGLLVVIWLSTFLYQIPMHLRLARGFDRRTQQWLVWSNWLRTILWTARALLLLSLLRMGN